MRVYRVVGNPRVIRSSSQNGPRRAFATTQNQQDQGAGFFSDLNEKNIFNWRNLEDLYDISSSTIKSHSYGSALLRSYNGSPYQLMRGVFPKHNWQWWKFRHTPVGFWQKPELQREYLQWLGTNILGFKTKEDWYKLTTRDLVHHGGRTLLQLYKHSPSAIVKSVFSDDVWFEWKFSHSPQGWWDSQTNRLQFFEALRKHYNLSSMEDLYGLKVTQIKKFGGSPLAHKSTTAQVVTSLYPQHPWEIWRFDRVPKGWWKDQANQLSYLQWLGGHLHYNSMDDWYQISSRIIRQNHGGGLVDTYNGQLQRLITKAFPHHSWLPWLFLRVSTSWWTSSMNKIAYCDWIEKQLGLTNKSEWYNITVKHLIQRHGRGLLARYRYSLYELLRDVYAKHDWKAWAFHKTPSKYWSANRDTDTMKKFVQDLAGRLGITESSLHKWHRISHNNLTHSEVTAISAFGGLQLTLQKTFPHHPWDFATAEARRSAQHELKTELEATGISSNIITEEQAIYGTKLWKTHPLTFDLVLAEKSIAFEYQGQQHYFDLRQYKESAYYATNDELKAVFCSMNAILLVTVPYWYNYHSKAISNTLQVYSNVIN